MRPVLLGLLLALLPPDGAAATTTCGPHWTTGYVRSEYGPYTFDGTPISTDEPIAAAGWDIPIDSEVWVEGLGTYRVADRGHLAPGQIDVAVWSRAEAYQATGLRQACVSPP